MVKAKVNPENTTETADMSASSISTTYQPSRVSPENYLSSGLTMLNLMTTNNPDCCVEKGTYLSIAGNSSSGKSLLCMQLLAEAANSPYFQDYELIYDDVEHGSLFDIGTMFGSKLASRMRVPHPNGCSISIEDFFFNVDTAQKEAKPFIYVLDSMDSLTSSQSDKKFDDNKAERAKDRADGELTSNLTMGMGDGKAKTNSANLRRVVSRLGDSILIVISQLRQNITGYGAKYTRSGGMALDYYCHQELRLFEKKKLEKTVNKIVREYGSLVEFQVHKNRITGVKPDIVIPMLIGYGFSNYDNILDWLIEEGVIPKAANVHSKISIPQLGAEMTREKFVEDMMDNFEPYKALCVQTWQDILDKLLVKRKSRYE